MSHCDVLLYPPCRNRRLQEQKSSFPDSNRPPSAPKSDALPTEPRLLMLTEPRFSFRSGSATTVPTPGGDDSHPRLRGRPGHFRLSPRGHGSHWPPRRRSASRPSSGIPRRGPRGVPTPAGVHWDAALPGSGRSPGVGHCPCGPLPWESSRPRLRRVRGRLGGVAAQLAAAIRQRGSRRVAEFRRRVAGDVPFSGRGRPRSVQISIVFAGNTMEICCLK